MSSQRYRRLLTNLPSMASVVNSFQSNDVQREVYHLLIEALDDAVADEDAPRSGDSVTPASAATDKPRRSGRKSGKPDEALADLVEGDSIHSIGTDG